MLEGCDLFEEDKRLDFCSCYRSRQRQVRNVHCETAQMTSIISVRGTVLSHVQFHQDKVDRNARHHNHSARNYKPMRAIYLCFPPSHRYYTALTEIEQQYVRSASTGATSLSSTPNYSDFVQGCIDFGDFFVTSPVREDMHQHINMTSSSDFSLCATRTPPEQVPYIVKAEMCVHM